MIYTFLDFVAKSRVYKKYKMKNSDLSILGVVEDNNGFLTTFQAISSKNINQKYMCQVWTESLEITNTSIVKFNCTCPSFLYHCSAYLNYINCLYGESNYNLPKKRTLTICKHLTVVINFLTVHPNLKYFRKDI